MPQVSLPVGGGNAVLDQRIRGRRIRNAQQRLGDAEQRHAFRGAEAVFGQEVGDVRTWPMRRARCVDQGAGTIGNAGRRRGKGEQRHQHLRLRCAV